MIDRARELWRDTRGASMVEYAVVTGTVSLAAFVAFIALGIALAINFEFVRSGLLYPYP